MILCQIPESRNEEVKNNGECCCIPAANHFQGMGAQSAPHENRGEEGIYQSHRKD